MNSKQISGLAVVSIAGGHKLGNVEEVYLDTELRKVLGYTVAMVRTADSGESAAPRWLPATSIKAIGPDALTVPDDTAVASSSTPESVIVLSEVSKRKVVTEGGTLVGQISSLELDPRGTSVASVEVSTGLFKSSKMVTPSQIVSMGDELMVVRDSVLADENPTTDAGGDSSEYRFLSGDVKAKETGEPEIKRIEADLLDDAAVGAKPADA